MEKTKVKKILNQKENTRKINMTKNLNQEKRIVKRCIKRTKMFK